ncbi:MAG: hypothetical protein FJ284_13295 [Planctomycetes bacterium]|nr:hypothetical protein [Planctomycetota bacterium]
MAVKQGALGWCGEWSAAKTLGIRGTKSKYPDRKTRIFVAIPASRSTDTGNHVAHRPNRPRRRLLAGNPSMMTHTARCSNSARGLVILGSVLVAFMPAAQAEIGWHTDLTSALAASTLSGKPVLAILNAQWAADSVTTATEVFASPEVEAVVSTCFEPVRLDVETHAAKAREFGVDRVPTACVLDARGQPLTSFECPPTPAAFVASAARAAHVAAAASQPATGSETVARRAADETSLGKGPEGSANATVMAVSNKVRQLSDFADHSGSDMLAGSRDACGDGSVLKCVSTDPPTTTYQTPSISPTLERTPPAWVADVPAAPQVAAAPAPGSRPGIEPQPGSAGSWLDASRSTSPPEATAAAVAPAVPAAKDAVSEKKPNKFLAALQKPWSMFSGNASKPAIEPPAQPPKMPPALPQWRAALASPTPPAEPDRLGPMPLGLEGYCPVTVVERGTWVEGRPQWGVRHRGRTYLFAGPDQQRAFLADPDRYAPALSGDDPVMAFEAGRSEPGRRAFGVTYQSRIYLFSSPETRATFTADPNRFTARVLIAEGVKPADGVRRF